MTAVTRRAVLKGAGALGLGALAGVAPAEQAQAIGGKGRRPNIVVFYIDDLGYGDLSCYGSTPIRTPNLDGMARRGMQFTNFYCGAPNCTPSRAALLTGCYAHRVNLPNVLFPNEARGLSKVETTIPEYLRQAGYATGMFGKWHLGDPSANPDFHPMEHGFDRYFGIPYSNDMNPLVLYDDRTIVERPPAQETMTRRLTEQAIAFMRAHKAEPFFAYIPQPQPHERWPPSSRTAPAAAAMATPSRRSTTTSVPSWAS